MHTVDSAQPPPSALSATNPELRETIARLKARFTGGPIDSADHLLFYDDINLVKSYGFDPSNLPEV